MIGQSMLLMPGVMIGLLFILSPSSGRAPGNFYNACDCLVDSDANSGSDAQCNGQNDRITVRKVTMTNSANQDILGGANELLIEDRYFENNGGSTILDHNIYVSHGNNITIRNNELYRSSLDTGGNCDGTSLVGHGVMSNLLIRGQLGA